MPRSERNFNDTHVFKPFKKAVKQVSLLGVPNRIYHWLKKIRLQTPSRPAQKLL